LRRVALTIEYDGTEFAGFQTQGQGERTVQSVLTDAVAKITRQENVIIHAAGRTDSGVHALGQVIHFDHDSTLSLERMTSGLNGILPRDVAVKEIWEPDTGFHVRFSAVQRTYVYAVLTRKQRSAILDRYSVHEPKPLDLVAMRSAARMLRGKHDFKSFANRGGNPGPTTVRHVKRLQFRQVREGEMLLIVISANGFLRSMVRNIVATLLDVGRGRLVPTQVRDILRIADREKNQCQTAPAKGLCLLKVDYVNNREGASLSAPMDEEG
jgi:tRNA pseudouridine38-40 synthase